MFAKVLPFQLYSWWVAYSGSWQQCETTKIYTNKIKENPLYDYWRQLKKARAVRSSRKLEIAVMNNYSFILLVRLYTVHYVSGKSIQDASGFITD